MILNFSNLKLLVLLPVIYLQKPPVGFLLLKRKFLDLVRIQSTQFIILSPHLRLSVTFSDRNNTVEFQEASMK